MQRQRDQAGLHGLHHAARSTLAGRIASGSADYERARHLPRVIPVGPDEVADESAAGRGAILRKLARALRAERSRGRAGHWTYDLNRHIALHQAYAAERQAAGQPTTTPLK